MDTRVDVKAVLRGVDLMELVRRDGVVLRGCAEKYGACPRCGGTDRFHVKVNEGVGYFFCRQCHERWGDAIEYRRWLYGEDFLTAVQKLQIRAGVSVNSGTPTVAASPRSLGPSRAKPSDEWQRQIAPVLDECEGLLWGPPGRSALAYLHEERGWRDDTIRASRLGYNTHARCVAGLYVHAGILIPTLIGGTVWQVRVRAFGHEEFRYKRVPMTEPKTGLFNADRLRGARVAVLCAGEFDAGLAQQYAPQGVACVTFGTECLNPATRWLVALRNVERLLVAYDNDAEGERGAAKWLLAKAGAQRVYVPGAQPSGPKFDVTDYWRSGGDLRAWLVGVVGSSDEVLLESVLDWGRAKGYEPTVRSDGHVVMARLEGDKTKV
jgi:hypothetical protein